VWGPFSADPELGHFYLTVEAPTNDIYGGHRHGNNLYSDSVGAVDSRTGRRVWHYQLIHHDVWDYDVPAHPILVDIVVDGRPIKALVQVTKQGYAYVFDRTNGKPVWPIEEKPVPQSDVPGEEASPTQPIPSKPPAFERQGLTHDDLIDFTPQLRAEAIKTIEGYRYGPLYTPPSVVTETARGTILVPGYGGGANWQSGAADPETGFVYVPSISAINVLGLSKNDPATATVNSDYSMGGSAPRSASGLNLLKPPYGRITAYDMNKGEIAWMIPNGDTPPAVKNNPALAGVNLPKTGSASVSGIMVTKTLLFAGEGSNGLPVFHAFDKATGEEVWRAELPGAQTGLPMTYMHQGRQYIVTGTRGPAGESARLVAFALPRPAAPGRQGGAGRQGGPAGPGGPGGPVASPGGAPAPNVPTPAAPPAGIPALRGN